MIVAFHQLLITYFENDVPNFILSFLKVVVNNYFQFRQCVLTFSIAIPFYNYQKAYGIVSHEWLTRVYQWIGVPEKVLNIIVKLMERWKTRLQVTKDRKVLTSRKSNIRKGFFEGDNLPPVGFCLTEVPISMSIVETDGYTMGQKD